MNGDITKIPVLSCGAAKQLSDIFPELPLPTACTDGVSNDTLISDPSLSNDVEQALNSNSEALISNVTDALSMVSTQNIDLVDETVAMPIDNANAPPILNFLLQRNSRVFNQECASSSHPNRANFNFNWDAQSNPNGVDNQHTAFDEDSSVKHQHKRKKRKRRRVESVDPEVMTDGESNGVSVSDWDSASENEPAARKSYEIKNTGGEALKLKISIKRATPAEISTSDNSSKERKQKKHKKSKDKKRHHSRDKSLPSSEGRAEQPIIPPANGIPMTAKPMLVTSPPREIFNSQRPPAGSSTSHSPHQFPFDFQGVFDQAKPDFSAFPVNLFEDLSAPHSNVAPNHPATNSGATPFSYNDFLSPDLLSSANIPSAPPPPHAHNPSPQASVYQGNFMVASHLDYPDNTHPDYSTSYTGSQTTAAAAPMGLASYLNSTKPQTISNNPPLSQPASTPVRPSAPVKPAARRRPPVSKRRRANEVEGLRSWTVKYPGQKNPTEKNSAAADESSAWDAVVDRQANYLRNKRRLTRQPTALANDFVLENDKDYPRPLPRRNSFEDDDGDESAIGGENDDADSHSDTESGKGVGGTSLRSAAARCSYAGMDEEGEDVPDEECYKDSSTRRRRKATDDDDAPFEVRIKEPAEQRFPHLQKVTAEQARPIRERVHHKPLNAYSEVLGGESASASSLKKFLSHIDRVLEAVEEVDLLAGGDNDDGIPQEAIISPADIAELVRDSAKLKSIQAANQVPTDRLLKLLTLLLLNIRDGANLVRITGDQESMEKISRAVGASLIALNLMTSKDMPREIYLEDVIEQAVQVTRFQLSNCIYPEYDPAYRIENAAKDNQSSIKSRRARERDTHKSTAVVHLYHRLVEVVSGLSELVHIQRLTDSLILSLCTVGVSIFFVENVSELQLAGLKLVPALYAHYHMCRQLITEELISGIARLPSSKRNLRTYRLNSEESIQMFTALSLLLIQSLIELPTVPSFGQQFKDKQQQESLEQQQTADAAADQNSSLQEIKPDDEVLVVSSYKRAVLTAHNFLASFLRKSTTRGEDDYRMIFENFVNDLLLTVNKPEWPAAEVMLSLLGSLLVQQFNNKSLDQSVRVTSVDYLGTVASTLRRDAVTSQLKEHDINVILRELTEGSQSDSEEEEEEEEQEYESHKMEMGASDIKSEEGYKKPATKKKIPTNLSKIDKILVLRDAVLDYLLEDAADPVVYYACKFYMGMWLEDCTAEVARAQKAAAAENPHPDLPPQPRPTPGRRNKRGPAAKLEDEGESEEKEQALSEIELAELRRTYLMDRLRDPPSIWRARCRPKVAGMMSLAPAAPFTKQSQAMRVMFKGSIDYEDAYLICRYLASLRPFSQSFDVYLSQICKLLSESSVPVRTKALRCLSAVVEADPGVLARSDIEMAVRSRLMDISTSVREAAVDLLGRFLICRPELTIQYYPMLSDRIRDKGVSVRKRVIRILRDICVEQPDFPRIPEIYVLIIRRVNDEESVKKLVSEVFQTLWFTPVREKESAKLINKVMNITDVVVNASKDTGIEWLEQFLEGLLAKEEGEKVRPAEKACVQIVECLVQNIMRLDEIKGMSKRLVACLATLHLFTKIRPNLTVKHAMLLHPYLSARVTPCAGPSQQTAQLDAHILHYVARILEVTISLMEHPSESFLVQLESDLIRVALRAGKMVVESCMACLGAVVNRVSKNYGLLKQCFWGFHNALERYQRDCIASLQNGSEPQLAPSLRPSILRALFTMGLLCKYFDIKEFTHDRNPKILDEIFDILLFFSEHMASDMEVRKNAISGLGFICTRHKEFINGKKLSKFYHEILTANVDCTIIKSPQLELKNLVLENLLNFLTEEERRMLEQDAQWKATHKNESLKYMGDVASGTGSSVAQTYLKEVLENFFSFSQSVRLAALSVVATILRQGLTHPVQTVPYLIAMQTDCDPASRVKAEAQLQEIENKFPGFTNMRAIEGVCFSYRLQCVLHAVKKASGGDRRESAGEGARDTSTEVGGNNSTSSSSRQTRRNADNGTTPADVTSEGGLNPFANAIRGAKEVDSDIPNALNSQLYSMLRANITSRRAFLKGMINLFDEMQDISLGRLVYVADNLAFFPYQCQAEPLFVIHHIDLLVSVNGSTRLQAVREAFFPELKELLAAQTALSNSGQSTSVANTWSSPGFAVNDIMHHPDTQSTQQASGIQEALMRLDLEEEKEDVLIGRVTSANAEQLNQIRESIRASRACLLLLNLKQYLKEVYGITDSKIQKFSPSDANKMWDKQLTRKSGVRFTPDLCLRSAIDELESEENPNSHENAPTMSKEMARDLVQEFFEFRKLILSIDPPDDEGLDGTVTNVDDTAGQANPAEDVPMRLAPDRSLVPQSHAPHSSDEEDDSADSDAAGASRLLLAQSAPQKRRGLRNHHTAARGSKAAPPSTSKRKSFSRQPRARSAFILSSESESEVESLSEEEESS